MHGAAVAVVTERAAPLSRRSCLSVGRLAVQPRRCTACNKKNHFCCAFFVHHRFAVFTRRQVQSSRTATFLRSGVANLFRKKILRFHDKFEPYQHLCCISALLTFTAYEGNDISHAIPSCLFPPQIAHRLFCSVCS